MKLAEFQKVGKMLAKEHKITIEEGQSWAANLKGRQVFYRKEDIYNLSEEHILGLLLHEIAHIHYTSNLEMPKDNPELTHATLNLLEDIAIEHIISKDYPNAGEILESTKTEVLDTLVRALPNMQATEFEKALLYGATRFEGRGYMFAFDEYEKLGEEISKLMIKRKDEIYERKQTKDLLPLALDIIKILTKKLGQPTDRQKYEIMNGAGMPIGAASNVTSQEEVKGQIIKGLKMQSGTGWKEGLNISGNVVFVDAIADQATIIGKKLRSVLKRNNSMEFGGRYRTGKLIAKRFVRVRASKDRKPFARRIVKSNQSYAFAIASDVSGSMFGNSYLAKDDPGSYALSSMLMVGEALKLAGVPRAMIIFGDKAEVVAAIGKTQIRWDQIADAGSIKKAHPGGTDIAAAIDACRIQLSKVRAERKIMIVLTDGSSYLPEMQAAHKKATAAGIECLGITIGGRKGDGNYMDTTFSEKKNTIIPDTKNTAQIGTAFIEILKKSIADSPK